jgi:hypothetical protein
VLPEVITGASDFAAAFSVESIPNLLHDFDCADLVKFREKLPQFPDASSTSRLRPKEDVLAIKLSMQENFGLPAGGKLLRTSPVLSLPMLFFLIMLLILANSQKKSIFLTFLSLLSLATRRGGAG